MNDNVVAFEIQCNYNQVIECDVVVMSIDITNDTYSLIGCKFDVSKSEWNSCKYKWMASWVPEYRFLQGVSLFFSVVFLKRLLCNVSAHKIDDRLCIRFEW